jgi:hypothetical protein
MMGCMKDGVSARPHDSMYMYCAILEYMASILSG